MKNLNEVFQNINMKIVAHCIFDRQQVRLISIISSCYILVACQEHSYMRREFKIMKLAYNNQSDEDLLDRPLIRKNVQKSVGLEMACDLNKSFKNLTKEIQCAILIKHESYIALLHDTTQIVIINEQSNYSSNPVDPDFSKRRWIEIFRIDC